MNDEMDGVRLVERRLRMEKCDHNITISRKTEMNMGGIIETFETKNCPKCGYNAIRRIREKPWK